MERGPLVPVSTSKRMGGWVGGSESDHLGPVSIGWVISGMVGDKWGNE